MTKRRRRPHPNVRQNLVEQDLIVSEPLLDGVNLGGGEVAGQPLVDQQHVGIEGVARAVVVLGNVFHMGLEGVQARRIDRRRGDIIRVLRESASEIGGHGGQAYVVAIPFGAMIVIVAWDGLRRRVIASRRPLSSQNDFLIPD